MKKSIVVLALIAIATVDVAEITNAICHYSNAQIGLEVLCYDICVLCIPVVACVLVARNLMKAG